MNIIYYARLFRDTEIVLIKEAIWGQYFVFLNLR